MRHVVMKTESVTLLNCRVNYRVLTALYSLLHDQIIPDRKSQLKPKSYSKQVHLLVHTMADLFFVLYQYKTTLEATRIALIIDITINI